MAFEELMEQGYNSDGQLGPFNQNGVENEWCHNMDAVVPEAPVVAVVVLNSEGGGHCQWS